MSTTDLNDAIGGRFHSVFVHAADAMLILDAERRVVDANSAAASLFGLGVEALTARSFDQLVVDGSGDLASAWQELIALGEARREHRVVSIGQGVRLVECSFRGADRANLFLAIVRDVTRRRQVEERLLQSERIDSVGRLAGGIAHDFNNLLTSILGYTELLQDNPSLDAQARADLREIQAAGQRAAVLTQQLLAYSRKQVLQPKDVDLNEIVTALQEMLSRLIPEDITLTCELATEPAVVRIDPAQLEQVVVNLVINARDALSGGGHIRLEVARVRLADVDIPAEAPRVAEYVRLRVVDTGVGITAEVRAHLFEPFFTTKEPGKGSGLGLASVYGIVRQSQGFISVESEPGRGAAFTMHFPAIAAVAPAHAAPPLAAPARQTILLVEDEASVRAMTAAVLRRQGYTVLEAETPGAAIDLFSRSGAGIDLLLTDVVMPAMNGPALAQRLVGIKPQLRVLFISGYTGMAGPIDAGAPNVAFLTKPFQGSTLAAKVREVLSPWSALNP